MKIEAAHRIMAVKADEEAAKKFLEELGFRHLSLKATDEEIIKFYYVTYDPKTLEKYLGDPKPGDNPRRLEYDFSTHGQIVVWTKIKTVTIKNAGIQALRVKPTETHVPPEVEKEGQKEEPKEPQHLPKTPGSKDNDDSKVPVTHISPELVKEYEAIAKHGSTFAYSLFMKHLWNYLNTEKFGGKMRIPNLGFIKDMGATSMRLRGQWAPMKRLLRMNPRVFNASQNFFVEIFLHEMCHQSVSEIDRVYDRTEQGHGPNWQAWMRRVGLNPRRFDPNDNTTYMKDSEKKDAEERKRVYKESLDKVAQEKQEKNLHTTPAREGKRATSRWGSPVVKLYSGYILAPINKARTKWAFITDDQIRESVGTGSIRWQIVDYLGFTNCDTPDIIGPEMLNKLVAIAKRKYAK